MDMPGAIFGQVADRLLHPFRYVRIHGDMRGIGIAVHQNEGTPAGKAFGPRSVERTRDHAVDAVMGVKERRAVIVGGINRIDDDADPVARRDLRDRGMNTREEGVADDRREEQDGVRRTDPQAARRSVRSKIELVCDAQDILGRLCRDALFPFSRQDDRDGGLGNPKPARDIRFGYSAGLTSFPLHEALPILAHLEIYLSGNAVQGTRNRAGLLAFDCDRRGAR